MVEMEKQTIEDRITRVLGENPSRDDVVLLLERLHSTESECEKSVRRNLLYIVVLWAVAYAIAAGMVEEGQIASFKVEKVQALLIVFPPLLAAFMYALCVAISGAIFRLGAITQIYKKLLPKLVDENLVNILVPSTFATHERFLSRVVSSRFDKAISTYWTGVLTWFLLFGSLAAAIHVSYLLWVTSEWPWYIAVVSIGIGAIIWARALILMATLDDLVE